MSLNSAHRDVLLALGKNGSAYTSNVTDETGFKTGFPTVSGVASSALEKRGLVKIKTSALGKTVSLTRAGRSEYNRVVKTTKVLASKQKR